MPGKSERYNAFGWSTSTGVRRAFSSWMPRETGREVAGSSAALSGLGTRPGTRDAARPRPREEEHRLHVEDQEQDRVHVVAHVDLRPHSAYRQHAALVRRALAPVRRVGGEDARAD